MYLLDTNVVSEGTRKKPDKSVLTWLEALDFKQAYLSVLTLGEIRKGVERVHDYQKKLAILRWLENDLLKAFKGRILMIETEVADKWGYLQSRQNLPAIDSLIAATALVHNCKLVTRNTKDFDSIQGLELINPWE